MKKLIVFILLTITLQAWEVTTHQALTRLALDGDDRAENMKQNYINEFNLSIVNYKNEGNIKAYWITTFSSYESTKKSFMDVALDLTSQAGLNISPFSITYRGLFEAGSILEDTLMSLDGSNVDNGRFNNHFFDPVLSKKNGECYSLGGSDSRECAKDWAIYTENNFKFNNYFSWGEAYTYYYKALTEHFKDTRKEYQAKLFVSLGHISHLVEDMTQPAHVRDDTHPLTNVFETWANDEFNAVNMQDNIKIFNATKNITVFNPKNIEDIFDTTALFTHNNFYSDDTISGDWFTGDHPHPENNVDTTTDSEKIPVINAKTYYYVRSNKLNTHNRLAIVQKKTFGREDYLLQLAGHEAKVLIDNSIHLFPKAVASIEGMINYFFRAKITARMHPTKKNTLIITNRIGQSEINSAVSTTIKSGSTFEVIEKANDDVLTSPVATFTLTKDLKDGESIEIEISKNSNVEFEPINPDDYRVVLKGYDTDDNRLVAGTIVDDKCKVFFTGLIAADHFWYGNISEIYKIDDFSEYVESGEYPDNTKAFPKAVKSTFDGIAIDKGTKITIYSGKNFTGNIVYQKVGPAVLNNKLWKNDSRYGPKVDTTWKEPFETEYPRNVREWSSSDMHSWSYGSTKIECGY